MLLPACETMWPLIVSYQSDLDHLLNKVINCPGQPQVYFVDSGEKRPFPTEGSLTEWGRPTITTAPCDILIALKDGPVMPG